MATIDVEDVLSKLTNPQKISLLSGKPLRTHQQLNLIVRL